MTLIFSGDILQNLMLSFDCKNYHKVNWLHIENNKNISYFTIKCIQIEYK